MHDMFHLRDGSTLPLPLFFPDATRGFVRELSWDDVRSVGLPGVLVNTFHLLREHGQEKTAQAGGARPMIGWDGAIISDSGGFQVMSIAKKGSGRITDEGVVFVMDGEEHLLTPEASIQYQLTMRTDLCVVLDDFTPPDATHEEAAETVRRTTLWAKRCKAAYERIVEGRRPYLIGVVQGGAYEDLRRQSIQELTDIGFDGYGYGGWPMKAGKFDTDTARLIATEVERIAPGALLYGLGIGKPDDIVICVDLGWQIFDCVLPTRDARHGRLYAYTAESLKNVDVHAPGFYTYYNPTQASHRDEQIPVSTACDCELCSAYTRAEFFALWKARDRLVLRLSTLHNLRFYARLMQYLQQTKV